MAIAITTSPTLKVHCYSLILNFKTVAGNIELLKEFQKITNCNFITNQELIITHDMMVPSKTFESIIKDHLLPHGFKWSDDFIIVEEQMLFGVRDRVTPLLHQGLPELKNVQWLDSVITMEGNFVWCYESELAKLETKIY
jgi:hypothetical protein